MLHLRIQPMWMTAIASIHGTPDSGNRGPSMGFAAPEAVRARFYPLKGLRKPTGVPIF